MDEITKARTPFVGLTTYRTEHSNHFYGREHAVEDVLSILQKNKFVCLTGSAGSGKSSLIQAGLIPRLLNGFKGLAGDQWSICSFRPSDSPLENFAQALSFDQVLSPENKSNTSDYLYYLDQIKEMGTGSLRSIYKNSELAGRQNLLIVIDQIEDIFHISEKLNYASSTDDDLLFDIVNKTVRYNDVAIYFVLITKTSYLTNLSQYSGLQELISKTQYAIQSLSLHGVNEIISQGFKDIQVSFKPDLVEVLYEELKEDNSLLPSFQLLLFNLYDRYHGNTTPFSLKIADLEGLENLKTLISKKFTSFYDRLEVDTQAKLALIFSAFYSPENQNSKSYITTLDQVKQSAGLSEEDFNEYYHIINRDFQHLMQIVPSLATQTKTDEGFSKWLGTDLLHLNYLTYFNPSYFEEWMRKESIAHWRFEEYVQLFKKHEQGEAGLLTSPQLDIAVEWLTDDLVNATWATKYQLPFKEVESFIIQSEVHHKEQINRAEFKREKESRKERFQKRLYLAFAVISVLLMLIAAYKWQDADAAREAADKEKVIAQQLMKENQIISQLIKIKSKAPSMLLQLQKVGNKNDKNKIIQQVQELITTELLFDSLNAVYDTSYVTDDWMHDLNVTALSLLEGKSGYTETSMLIGDLKTYPVLDFSIYNNEQVAFIGHSNKLSITDLDDRNRTISIDHKRLFNGQVERVLFIEDQELLLLTDRNELFQLSIATEEVTLIHKANQQSPIRDFIYDSLEQLIVIIKDEQLIFKSSTGQEQVIDQLGNHYTAHFYNNQLHVATTQGVFLVVGNGAMSQLRVVQDSNPSFIGLTEFYIKADYVFVGFENGQVKMYQMDQGSLILKHVFSLDEHSGKITSIYYNGLEKVLYTAAVDDRIFRYNLRIKDDEVDEDFSELKGHKSTVWKIDGFKNDKGQEILITADQEGHLLSWYIDDLDMVRELKILADNKSKDY